MTGVAAERGAATHERPWAVGVYLSFAALVGLALSAPFAAAVGGVTGAYPRGDAEVLDPGGVMLIEVGRRLLEQAGTLGAAWAIVAAAALPAGLFVLAFALACYAPPGRAGPLRALARAARSFGTFAVLGLTALIAGVVVAALILVGGGQAAGSAWPDPPGREAARGALILAAVAAVVAVGVVHDLARAAAVVGPMRAYSAMRAALLTARSSGGRAAWAYAWRALVGLSGLAAATWLAAAIGQRSAGGLVATAVLHQAGLALVGWMRLSWLSAAVRLVRPVIARRSREIEPVRQAA